MIDFGKEGQERERGFVDQAGAGRHGGNPHTNVHLNNARNINKVEIFGLEGDYNSIHCNVGGNQIPRSVCVIPDADSSPQGDAANNTCTTNHVSSVSS